MPKRLKIKMCKICKVLLTPQNSYYPKPSNLFCKKHYNECRINYPLTNDVKARNISVNKASKKAYIKHKEKWIARGKARYAVLKGIIIKPKKCEVCEKVKPLQGHHEDYSKPLEVIWLCSKCHVEADKALVARSNPSVT